MTDTSCPNCGKELLGFTKLLAEVERLRTAKPDLLRIDEDGNTEVIECYNCETLRTDLDDALAKLDAVREALK